MFKKTSKSGGGDDQIQLLSLSLFMLLLAFFIVLSTLIEFDKDKMSELRTGIEQAFMKGAIIERGPSEDNVGGDKIGTGIERIFGNVEDLLRTNIGVFGLQKVGNSGAMIVTVPEDELFALDPDILAQIAKALRGGENEIVRYELEVLGGINDDVRGVDTSVLDEKIQKLGKFARTMVDVGVLEHRLSVGIIRSKSTMVDLIFYARRSDKPFVKLDPGQINRGMGGGM